MDYFLHLFGLAVTAALSLGVAWWVRRQTDDRVGTAMIGLLVLHASMAILAGAQLLSPGETAKVALGQLWYALGLVAPVFWFLLAVYFTGREHWLTRPVWGVLLAGPAVSLAVWLTDFYHGRGIVEVRTYTEPFVHVQPIYSDLTLLLVGTINVFTIFAMGLFIREFLFARRGARWQAAVVVGGMLAIFTSTAVSDAPFVPAPGFPYGVFGAGVFGALVAVGLFRTRMFVVLPMARETVFETIEDAIVVVDADRRIVDFNAAAADRLSDLDEAVSERLEDVYPELVSREDSGATNADDRTALDVPTTNGARRGDDRTPFAETVRITRNGETRLLRNSVSVVDTSTGPRGYALILRDVTAIEEYASELERRTEQLEQFAGVLSHDLRNPVSIASGYLELADETGNLEYVREGITAIERIDETIDDLLLLAREGRAIDELEEVALYRVVSDAWATSATGEVTLENDVSPDVRLRTDPSRLRTAFENLFRNVADHGGGRVKVALLEDGSAGFFVEDDGPGIPDEERERVFEYGYTGTGGTGLGLSIVDSIADAHGWDLRVTQSRWGGARFEIRGVDSVPAGRTKVDRNRSTADAR